MRIRVERPFLLDGLRQEAGTTIEVSDHLARELVHCGKAAMAAPTRPAAGPMTTETTAAVVAGPKPARKAATKPAKE